MQTAPRRRFLRDLLGRTMDEWERAKLEFAGVPQRMLSDLRSLPDGVLRQVIPVLCTANAALQPAEVYRSPHTSNGNHGHDWPALDEVETALADRFGNGQSLADIAAWGVDQGLLDDQRSWARTRSLFLRLVAHGVCHPSQAMSDVGMVGRPIAPAPPPTARC